MEKVFLVGTQSGMFRAQDGARYPWTENAQEARTYPTADKARAEAHSHASFMDRPQTDYRIYERAEDGSLIRHPVTTGGRLVDTRRFGA